MIELYRLEDGRRIGRMSKEDSPYEIEFTNQAVLVDKDFFERLLSRPYLVRGRFNSEKVHGTTIRRLPPEDVGFLRAVLGDLPLRGYLAVVQEKEIE